MGSDLSKQVCCVTCHLCRERRAEEANDETSETKPILQPSREASIRFDTQPSPPALEVSEEVQSLSQDRRPSADASEENTQVCSAADPVGMTEGWEAAWDCTDFLVAPADGETKGEVEVLTPVDNQQERKKAGDAEEKVKPVPDAPEAQPAAGTAWDAKLVADQERSRDQAEAGSEGSPCAGVTPQEKNTLTCVGSTSETAAGQDGEIEPPPAETGESLIGRNLPLCAAHKAGEMETYPSAEHAEELDRAKLAEISPRPAMRAEPTSLVETAFLLAAQATQKARETADPLEAVAHGMAEMYPAAVPWESLYPHGESLELANQLLDFWEQETQSSLPTAQEMDSLGCAEPAEPREALRQSSGGVLCDLGDEESRECGAQTAASGAEPQHRITPQTIELPQELLTCVQIPVKQEAKFLNVAPSASEVLGSSGEIEAENVAACET